MKISHYEKIITPSVGTTVAGYAPHDVSVRVHDDLKLCILLMDDGENKGAVLSFDLIGLDDVFTEKISADAAAILGCPARNVILTCTHTHSGPHTRSLRKYGYNEAYMNSLYIWVKEAMTEAVKEWTEVDTYFYSCRCDENYNRRFVDGANQGKYLPLHRSLEPLAFEHKDQELGLLLFYEPGTPHPVGVLANFAAHPLASHSMGLGSHQISADFPGVLRDVMADNSCWCVFLQGAAGDQFPKDAECGFEAARRCANGLAIEIMRALCDAARNRDKYFLPDPRIRALEKTVSLELRQDEKSKSSLTPALEGKKSVRARLHFLAVDDICFVGVPCELLGELGQEIKWHSPFRKTFILYNSTGYLSYICHANAFIAGGYETDSSHVKPFSGLELVVGAVEGMRELHAPLPEEL